MDKLMAARALMGEAREIEQAAGHKDRAMAINNLILGTFAVATVVINTEAPEVSS
jgi:hypothetical protein